MTKIIKIDDMEIEFEKQNPESSCKWCVYVRVRKKDNDRLLSRFSVVSDQQYAQRKLQLHNRLQENVQLFSPLLGIQL